MPAPDSILAALLGHAAADPQRPCVIWRGAVIGYGQLAAAAAAWAARYAELGVMRGDRVGLYLGNTPAFLAAYLGAHMAGAAAVLINTQYRQTELGHILADSAPRAVVGDAESAPELRMALGQLRAQGVQIAQLTCDDSLFGLSDSPGTPFNIQHSTFNIQPPQAADLAILAYTSGTTGRSKGAMLTHSNLVSNSAAVTSAWGWTERDRLLLTLPLFHIHGLGVGVHGTLLAGASMDLRPRFDPDEALAALADGTITMFFGVPTIYGRLLHVAPREESAERSGHFSRRLSSLRLFVSGSAALPPQVFEEFRNTFGHAILERYGMTETVMNLTNPYAGERRPGTVGGPFPGQEARVVGVRSRQPLPAGEVGEIQVRGPHVCAGYWRNPTATAEVFGADGWFSTGDLGMCSADGYFTITGRARELIISGGYNIYPREVEERLLAHPAVAECAVRGLPDADFGEQVAAWVVMTPESRPSDAAAEAALSAELTAFCREGLAAYKRPRQIHYVDALPRNAMGKVQKHLLA
ncbi:acyl-CoA synthetase [Oscillochloris sp. ZM17-4]|uniref:acyl-CoA synthetase n=1 Tax=Oscillochloris sp. ZM17-4 TaxID=2866714 RepID=UPI001C7396AC|nr:acyl-CoA synthetase [Oscillochloris sp. ZM17-4]